MAQSMIKPSHKGRLHKALGVPAGQKIPIEKLSIKQGDSEHMKQMKQFALNEMHFNHN